MQWEGATKHSHDLSRQSNSAIESAIGNAGGDKGFECKPRISAAIFSVALKLGAISTTEPVRAATSCRRRGPSTVCAEGFLRLAGNGHADLAAASLEESLKILTQNVDRVSRFGAYGLMALTQLRRGDLIAARRAADFGIQLAIKLASPTGYYSLNGYYGVARTYLALWEHPSNVGDKELPKLALCACQALRRYGRIFPVGRPSSRLCDGLNSWLCGKHAARFPHGAKVWLPPNGCSCPTPRDFCITNWPDIYRAKTSTARTTSMPHGTSLNFSMPILIWRLLAFYRHLSPVFGNWNCRSLPR